MGGWRNMTIYIKLVTVFKMNVISMEEMKTSIFDMLGEERAIASKVYCQ